MGIYANRKNEKIWWMSARVKVMMIIVILVFPLNILSIYQNKVAIDTMLEQRKLSFENIADVQMKELEKKMENQQFLLSYFNIQDANCIRMMQQPQNEYQYKSAMYRFYHTLKTITGMMQGGDGYYYYLKKKSDMLYHNLDTDSRFKKEMIEFIQERCETSDYNGWEFVEFPFGKYYILFLSMKDVSYGGWINLDRLEKELLAELGEGDFRVTFSDVKIQADNQKWLQAEAGEQNLKLTICVDKRSVLGDLPGFQLFNRIISFLYLALIPVLYLVLSRLLFNPYSKAENELLKVKIENYEYENARQKMEMENLQLQIRPHFLQNTFNLLYELAQKNETMQMQSIILYLSDYFRHIFRNDKEVELFQKELKLVDEFIKMASIKYDGNVKIEYQIDPEIYLVRVPPLLIHNFVENAIKHGIKEKKTLHIKLEGYYQNFQVIFIISDDGNGMSKEILEKSQRILLKDVGGVDHSHIGLYNSVKRLKYIYGNDATVWIESEIGEGTSVMITIPYNLESEDESVDRE